MVFKLGARVIVFHFSITAFGSICSSGALQNVHRHRMGMRYAGVFKGRRAKQEDRAHRMSFRNLQGALKSLRQLEGVNRKAAPAGAKSVCLRQQIEIAEGNPWIRLLARRLPGRGGDYHAGRVAEDDVVAAQNFIHIATEHGVE